MYYAVYNNKVWSILTYILTYISYTLIYTVSGQEREGPSGHEGAAQT